MKWYSVKTHSPQLDVFYLIRGETGSLYYACRISKGWYREFCEQCSEVGDSNQAIKDTITHFCMPDPVEIEIDHIADVSEMVETDGIVKSFLKKNGLIEKCVTIFINKSRAEELSADEKCFLKEALTYLTRLKA